GGAQAAGVADLLQEHDPHHAAVAARAPGRDQRNDEGAQPDAARPAGGQDAQVRAVHATVRAFLRSRSAEDARRVDPTSRETDGADGVADAVAVAGDAAADARSPGLHAERPGVAGADGRARRPAGAALASPQPWQPLRLLRFRVPAVARGPLAHGAAAGHRGSGGGAARGLPGSPADPGASAAAPAVARAGRAPGG